MNINILSVVTPLYIYHGCSTQKMFWEEKFTPVITKKFGRCNVRKHRDINYGDNYTTLYIYLDFGSLENMEITSSEPKYYLGISVKGLITYLGIKNIITQNKNKKARYTITNVSLKNIYRIIKEFEKLPYEGYVQKRFKHLPTDIQFYLAIQLAKCMMRLNLHIGPVRTQMTTTQDMNNSEMSMHKINNLNVRSTDKS